MVDYGFAKILRIAESSYLTVVKADEGMHSADEPKTVTMHLVTDELNRWYDHVVERGLHSGVSLRVQTHHQTTVSSLATRKVIA